jgi:hypothetical protein
MEKENEWNYTAVSLYWQYKKVTRLTWDLLIPKMHQIDGYSISLNAIMIFISSRIVMLTTPGCVSGNDTSPTCGEVSMTSGY